MISIVKRFVLEILYILRLYTPKTPNELLEQYDLFIKINKKNWISDNYLKSNILIEGHLSTYGPNYLFRTSLAAKSIQQVFKNKSKEYGIDVIFNGFQNQFVQIFPLYKSFGINSFLVLGNLFF